MSQEMKLIELTDADLAMWQKIGADKFTVQRWLIDGQQRLKIVRTDGAARLARSRANALIRAGRDR